MFSKYNGLSGFSTDLLKITKLSTGIVNNFIDRSCFEF
jgi:hypothetical protein